MKIEKLEGKIIKETIGLYDNKVEVTKGVEAPNNFELQNKINELIDAFNEK